jgi:hypothetical protein
LNCVSTSGETSFAAWERKEATCTTAIVHDIFINNMFWRNTKESIGKEFKGF